MASGQVENTIILGALEDFQSALNQKQVRFNSPTVIRLPAKRPEVIEGIPRGSIAVFVAAEGSEVLERVGKLAKSRDFRAIDRLVKSYARGIVKNAFGGQTRYGSYDDVPVFGELRYAGRTLAHGFFLDKKRDLALEVLPYNGGRLRSKQFNFVEYYTPDTKEQLGCIIVISPPQLTPLERQLVHRVPKDLSEMNIGQSKVGFSLVAATLTVVALAATIVATYYVHCEMVGYKSRGENDPDLKATDPGASAGSLLQQRVEMMKRKK